MLIHSNAFCWLFRISITTFFFPIFQKRNENCFQMEQLKIPQRAFRDSWRAKNILSRAIDSSRLRFGHPCLELHHFVQVETLGFLWKYTCLKNIKECWSSRQQKPPNLFSSAERFLSPNYCHELFLVASITQKLFLLRKWLKTSWNIIYYSQWIQFNEG